MGYIHFTRKAVKVNSPVCSVPEIGEHRTGNGYPVQGQEISPLDEIGNKEEGWIYTVKTLFHLPEIENQLIALPSSVVIALSHLCFA